MSKLTEQLIEVENKLTLLYNMGANDENLVDEKRRLEKLIKSENNNEI